MRTRDRGGDPTINGEPGRPESFDALHELLEAQAYRLSYWRTASHEINYRRFFDINTLAGLRVENQDVFDATHQLLAQLIRDGKVQAVRIDHPDGLFDPGAGTSTCCRGWRRAALGLERRNDAATAGRPLYVVAEKILSGGERLPPRWAVHGTTGYNFLNDLNGLFVERRAGTADAPGLREADRPDASHSTMCCTRASG